MFRNLAIGAWIVLAVGCADFEDPPVRGEKWREVAAQEARTSGRRQFPTGGWEPFTFGAPAAGAAPRKVRLTAVRVETPYKEFAARTTIDELEKLVAKIDRAAEAAYGDSPTRFTVSMWFRCEPTSHMISLRSAGDVPKKETSNEMSDFGRAFDKLNEGHRAAVLLVSEGEVSFVVDLSIEP